MAVDGHRLSGDGRHLYGLHGPVRPSQSRNSRIAVHDDERRCHHRQNHGRQNRIEHFRGDEVAL